MLTCKLDLHITAWSMCSWQLQNTPPLPALTTPDRRYEVKVRLQWLRLQNQQIVPEGSHRSTERPRSPISQQQEHQQHRGTGSSSLHATTHEATTATMHWHGHKALRQGHRTHTHSNKVSRHDQRMLRHDHSRCRNSQISTATAAAHIKLWIM